LGPGLDRRIEVDGMSSGHYWLEDTNGVYLAEFHSGSRQPVHLIRPKGSERLYLNRRDGKEFVIESPERVVRTASLTLSEPSHAVRGAAHEAFHRMFALPFTRANVQAFVFRALPEPGLDEGNEEASWRKPVGYGLLGLGAASGVFSGLMWSSAREEAQRSDEYESQADVARANDRIHRANLAAGIGLGVGVATAVSGAMILLWPESPVELSADVSEQAAGATLNGEF
jgi:hypothetical protein